MKLLLLTVLLVCICQAFGTFSQQGQYPVNQGYNPAYNPGYNQVHAQINTQVPYQGQYQVPHQGQYQVPLQGQYQVPLQGQYQVPLQGQYQVPHQGQCQVPHQGQYQVPHQGQYPLQRPVYSQAPTTINVKTATPVGDPNPDIRVRVVKKLGPLGDNRQVFRNMNVNLYRQPDSPPIAASVNVQQQQPY